MVTEGSGVSEIVVINDHQFLMSAMAAAWRTRPCSPTRPPAAEVKKLFLIDLDGAQDVTSLVATCPLMRGSQEAVSGYRHPRYAGGTSDTDSTTTNSRKYIPLEDRRHRLRPRTWSSTA